MRKQMRQWSTQGSAVESAAVERPDTPRRCPGSSTSWGNCDTAVIRRPRSTSHDAWIVFGFWSGARDLNPGPHGPEL
jgi:hypothetical protein